MAGSFAQHFSEVLAGTELRYFKESIKRGVDSFHIKTKWITIRIGEDQTLAKVQI